MTDEQFIKASDVLAQWGYSELTGSPASRHYADLIELIAKRKNGVDFGGLSEVERYALALRSGQVRTALLLYLVGADRFRKVELSKRDLNEIWVAPNVWWPASEGRLVPFAEYLKTTHSDSTDARNVEPPEGGYRPPTDLLTIGRWFDHPVLIDGYHRVARFIRFGPDAATLWAYWPKSLPR